MTSEAYASLEAEAQSAPPARARELLEEALRLRDLKYGPEHLAVAGALVALGAVSGGARRVEVLERAAWIQERCLSYGPEAGSVVATLASLADAHEDLGGTARRDETLERRRRIEAANAGFAASEDSLPTARSLAAQRLSKLPPEVLDLSSLVALDVSRNLIAELPREVCHLRDLESLDVSRNRLRVLPAELGELSALRRVNAFHNQLRPLERSVPLAELAALPRFALLDLRWNPKIKEATVAALARQRLPGVDVLLSGAPPPLPKQFAADRDAQLLQSQLEPFSVAELCERLSLFGEAADPEEVERWWVMERLLEHYAARGPRPVRRVLGRDCDPALLDELLAELRASRWPSENERERKKIRASGYIILARPPDPSLTSKSAQLAAFKLKRHARVWELASQVMEAADPDFAASWTAVAMTRNFVGSPHIDHDNTGPFYGLALGDFEGGGIRVEAGPFEVVEMDTRRRLGKVDGRFPHWVAPYTGERYSLIFYQTWGDEVPRTTAVFE